MVFRSRYQNWNTKTETYPLFINYYKIDLNLAKMTNFARKTIYGKIKTRHWPKGYFLETIFVLKKEESSELMQYRKVWARGFGKFSSDELRCFCQKKNRFFLGAE